MMTHAGRLGAFAISIGLLLLASPAFAGNGTKPRIPVDWSDAACMTIVDRSASAMVHLSYSVTQEDTELTPDEVDDSRTHQFFSLCRAHNPQTFLPRWITQDDIDRAAMVESAPDNVDPEDIFESNSEWAGCWHRINADDDRRPITFAAAAAGIDWDTTTVPAGTYVVEAYTWEPPLNIWSRHPGVVKVVDSPDLAASGPALAVSNREEVINKNESVVIEGCVSAMEGSTVTAYWGMAGSDIEWQSFIEDDPISGDTFQVELTPPDILAGESVMIRVDVNDPMGRSYTSYMHELVIVLGTDGPGDCEDGGGFIGGAGCEDDTGSATAGSDDATAGSGDPTTGTATSGTMPPSLDGGDDGGTGCGCHASGTDAPGLAGLALLGLLGWRRRRATHA